MKKLLLSLIVLSTIFSCGKNNSVSSNPGVSGLSAGISGPSETDLANKINNNSFGTGNVYPYLTWAQLISNQPNITYYYYKTSQSTSNCSTKWGIFYICSSSSSSNNATFSRSVVNSSVNINSKKSELINIINKRTSIQTNGSVYYIYTNDNQYYIIDTAKPLQMNPVQTQTGSTIEYFSNAM